MSSSSVFLFKYILRNFVNPCNVIVSSIGQFPPSREAGQTSISQVFDIFCIFCLIFCSKSFLLLSIICSKPMSLILFNLCKCIGIKNCLIISGKSTCECKILFRESEKLLIISNNNSSLSLSLILSQMFILLQIGHVFEFDILHHSFIQFL